MAVKCESKYERLRKIGIGSYGIVFKCVNRQTGQVVAIKRYSENDADPIIRKIAMREVRMLRQLQHPNLIHLIEVFRRKRKLHLVFEYCELTVLDVIEKYGNNCPLNLIKKIIWQTVNAISYCHSHNCIHRDIKPENILINQLGVVKLCDFGFARTINKPNGNKTFGSRQVGRTQQQLSRQLAPISDREEQENGAQQTSTLEETDPKEVSNYLLFRERQALTEYVATRWYRAPELLIGEIYYDIKIDIWAIGCVAGELMRGQPMWPGKTDLDQLCIIQSSLGQLTPSQTYTLLSQNIYDKASIDRLLSQRASLSESIDRKIPARIGQIGLEFVKVCLQMDPSRRPTSDELLRHGYIHSARMTQFVTKDSASQVGSIYAPQTANCYQIGASKPSGSVVQLTRNNNNNVTSSLYSSKQGLNSQSLAMLTASTTNLTASTSNLPQGKPMMKAVNKRPVASSDLTSTLGQTNNLPSITGKGSSIPRAISRPVLADKQPHKQAATSDDSGKAARHRRKAPVYQGQYGFTERRLVYERR